MTLSYHSRFAGEFLVELRPASLLALLRATYEGLVPLARNAGVVLELQLHDNDMAELIGRTQSSDSNDIVCLVDEPKLQQVGF